MWYLLEWDEVVCAKWRIYRKEGSLGEFWEKEGEGFVQKERRIIVKWEWGEIRFHSFFIFHYRRALAQAS